jgi:hypothetical protein
MAKNAYILDIVFLCFISSSPQSQITRVSVQRRYNGRFQMQGGKNWILPKEIKANWFFWDFHWLEIWSNRFCPSMGPNGGSVAMDSVGYNDFYFLKEKKISQTL